MENKNFEGSKEGTGALYEFFTPDDVVKKMWQLYYKYTDKKENDKIKILEPAAGSGRLLEYAPKNSNITAFEVAKENFDILKNTYPDAEIHNLRFETSMIEPPRFSKVIKNKVTPTWLTNFPFDLVIANPPYGSFSGTYKNYFDFKGQYEHFFVLNTLKMLRSGGMGIYLIPSSFIRNGQNYQNVKESILEIAHFVDAYRMPSNIFKKTQIGTDIIIFKKK